METITPENKILIEKFIKNNKKYSNNEDLYDDFFSETCKNSLSLMTSVKSGVVLELYLQKVVSNSMVNVLKNSGRLRRTNGKYKSVQNVSCNVVTDEFDEKFLTCNVAFKDANISETPEDLFIKREILKSIAQTLNDIDKAEPSERYLDIFKLRYDKGLTQREIAENLGISQSEVSKKLFKLMKKVKESLN